MQAHNKFKDIIGNVQKPGAVPIAPLAKHAQALAEDGETGGPGTVAGLEPGMNGNTDSGMDGGMNQLPKGGMY